MALIIVGLVKEGEQARRLIRALDDAGFSGDDLEMKSGPHADLVARGVPEQEAHAFAEGVRRGGTLVCVRAEDEDEAAEAAHVMGDHGALDIDACIAGWRDAGWSGRYEHQPHAMAEHYAAVFGEYPSGPGRIYQDARARREPYSGPERRVRDEPYPGVDRRAI
jgi:hypothetical protein